MVAALRTMSRSRKASFRRRLAAVWDQPERDEPAALLAEYVATLEAGVRLAAMALWDGWRCWVRERSPRLAVLGLVAFGRLAGRCPGLARGRERGGRRLYTVLPRAGERTSDGSAGAGTTDT